MINVGIAGIGFMGWIHWLAYKAATGVRVAAISSRDPKRRAGDWRNIKGNFGPPGEQVDLKGVKAFESLEAMLADPSIDLVDLCLPPNLHLDAALQAFAAGKHVFCEKPLALTDRDCVRSSPSTPRRAGSSPRAATASSWADGSSGSFRTRSGSPTSMTPNASAAR
jgi:predicted dehydrogenase